MKPKIKDSSSTVEIVITKVNDDKGEMCKDQDVIGSNTITIYVCELCSQQYHSLGLVHAHMQTYHRLIPSSGISQTGNQQDIEQQLPEGEETTLLLNDVVDNTIKNGLNIHAVLNDEEQKKTTEEDNSCFNFPQFEVLICQTCNKSFRTTRELVRHMKSHIEEKNFVCKVCFKTFREASNLKIHQRTHTGERPYCCTKCGKQFRYHKDYTDHLVVHSGERIYVCSGCDKRYFRRRDLMRHMKSKH